MVSTEPSSSSSDNLWHQMDAISNIPKTKWHSCDRGQWRGGILALAGGSKDVTAVEPNPLKVLRARHFNGDFYDRSNVNLFIDDGTRFNSATTAK
jgi:hypothetical protein